MAIARRFVLTTVSRAKNRCDQLIMVIPVRYGHRGLKTRGYGYIPGDFYSVDKILRLKRDGVVRIWLEGHKTRRRVRDIEGIENVTLIGC